MAIAVTQIEVQEDSTTGTSLQSGTISASVAVGDQVWVLVTADNAGASGVSSITAPTDSGGNTYSLVKEQNRTSGAANDGDTAAIYRSIITTALTTGVSTITANFSPTTVVKGFLVFKVTGAADAATGTVGGSGTGTTYSLATSSMGTDTLVMMIVVQAASSAPGADSDTTNGSWTQATYGSSALGAGSNLRSRSGYKIVTASGAQTFNGSIVSQPWAGAGAWVGFKISSSFTADAVLAVTGGTFTADAALRKTQSASANADAVVLRAAPGAIPADAVTRSTVVSGRVVDAILLRTQTQTPTANAVFFRSQAGSATADAEIAQPTAGASFTGDAILRSTSALTYTANAVLRTSSTSTWTADALLVRTVASSATANAVLKRARSGSTTANAVIDDGSIASSFTGDAYITIGTPGDDSIIERWQHHRLRDHFGYESDLYVTLSGRIGPWEEGTPIHYVIEDLLTRMDALEGSTHKVFSFTADATFLAPGGPVETTAGTWTSVFTGNAIKKRTMTGSFTASAYFDHKGSFTANAWIRFQGSFTCNAILV